LPSAAFSAYGTEVRVGDGIVLPALTITAASNTVPIVVTTSTPHNVIDVSYGTITGITGTTSANGGWVLQAVTPTTLQLRKSVGNGAYISGGTLTLASTFAAIAELRDVQDAGKRADLIDVSAHDGNGYDSQLPVLKRTNAMRLPINLVPEDPTHEGPNGLLGLFDSGAKRHWLLVLPPPTPGAAKPTVHLYGAVQGHTFNFPVTGADQGDVTLTFDGPMTWTGA
jgi:hypothetical protein